VYSIETELRFPLEETLLPIAKKPGQVYYFTGRLSIFHLFIKGLIPIRLTKILRKTTEH
jgi:hypothetical protein